MENGGKTWAVLLGLSLVFLVLAGSFALDLWGKPPQLPDIPPVDPEFTSRSTIRKSYATLIREEADVTDFDCYICHEKDKPPTLKYDADHNLIIPSEHSNIVMAHGRHNRNNNCYNCHDEENLEQLQTRDGRELKLSESPPLCGSCHGPTYRDWEAGAHGRTGGYWSKAAGETSRQLCADCHNPHHPKIPPRKPAPAPHPLRPVAYTSPQSPH